MPSPKLSRRPFRSRFVFSLGLLCWPVSNRGLIHAATATAAAATTPARTEAPPNLPLGDINVVILTDVHSWVASHRRQEPQYDADLGNILSFWEHLKERVERLPSSNGNSNSNIDQNHRVTRTTTGITTSASAGTNATATAISGDQSHSQGEDLVDPEMVHPHHPPPPPPPMPEDPPPGPPPGPPPEPPPDIFLVNNGDFIHGTGLSRMIDGQNDPSALIPLLEKMPYDAVNVGNHELYSKRNIDAMTRPGGYIDWWGDRYLTSNIRSESAQDLLPGSTKPALGNPYKILHGSNGGSRLLAFGFLYNMPDYAEGAGISIDDVESVVEQEWFRTALTEERYDAILVLAHMDLVDPLVETIRAQIRKTIGEGTPLVFVTGHTHYRGAKQLEDLTLTVEAGRYLDTVGFVSFPRKESVRSDHAASLFHHTFLDANRKVLFEDTLGFSRAEAEDADTPNGRELSSFIERTRMKMGLETEIACAPQSYFAGRRIDDPESLWGLFRDQVIPKIFSNRQTMATIEEIGTNEEDNLPMAMLIPQESWRYDLYNHAPLIVDDVVAVAPFNDTLVHLGTFSRSVILQVNKTVNQNYEHALLPNYILIDNMDDFDTFKTETAPGTASKSISATKYHLYTHEFNGDYLRKVIRQIDPSEPVEIRSTEFTSTGIWLQFVQEYWPCGSNAETGTTSWIPTYQSVVKNLNNERGEVDRTRLLVAIGILVAVVGILATALAVVGTALRRYLSYQPVEMAAEGGDPPPGDGIYKVGDGAATDDDDKSGTKTGEGPPTKWQDPEFL